VITNPVQFIALLSLNSLYQTEAYNELETNLRYTITSTKQQQSYLRRCRRGSKPFAKLHNGLEGTELQT